MSCILWRTWRKTILNCGLNFANTYRWDCLTSIVLYMVNKGRNNNLTGQNVSITCCNCELPHIFLYNSVRGTNTRHSVYRVGRWACGRFVFRLVINRDLLCPSRDTDIYYSLSRSVSSYLLTYICQNSIVPNGTLFLFFLCVHKAAKNVEQLLLLMFELSLHLMFLMFLYWFYIICYV